MTTSPEVLFDLKFMNMNVFAMCITTELASITLACLRLGDDRCAGQAGLHKPTAKCCCQSNNGVVLWFSN